MSMPAKTGVRAKILAYLLRNGLSVLADIMVGIEEPNRAKTHGHLTACSTAGLIRRKRDDVTGMPGYEITDEGRAWLKTNSHNAPDTPKPTVCDTSMACTKSQTASNPIPSAEAQAATPEVTPFDAPTPEIAATTLTDAQREEFTLLGVIADIRKAIGDPEGKIMLSDLAAEIQDAYVFTAQIEADHKALRFPLMDITDDLFKNFGQYAMPFAVRTIGQLIDAHSASLQQLCDERADLRERLDSVTQQSIADTALLTDKNAKLHAEIEHLREELATAKSEAIALKTLEEAMPGFGAEHQALRFKSLETELTAARAEARETFDALITKESTPYGYILRADKRPDLSLSTFKKHETAVNSAASAIRKGAKRVRLFALVPAGQVVQGAEFHD